MISRDKALSITEQNFPNGPEALATALGIEVNYSPLMGCDGWYIRAPAKVIIRVNSNVNLERQRFTLAHELAHLINGTKSQINISDPFAHDNIEERVANTFASQMLIPASFLNGQGIKAPFDVRSIARIAKRANVSVLACACGIAVNAEAIGITNAHVTYFGNNGAFGWQFSRNLDANVQELETLFNAAQSNQGLFREQQVEGTVVVSLLKTARYFLMFGQLLPANIGNQETDKERRNRLNVTLFAGDTEFQNRLNGYVNAFKQRSLKENRIRDVSQATSVFLSEMRSKLTHSHYSRLASPAGREFLKDHFARWLKL